MVTVKKTNRKLQFWNEDYNDREKMITEDAIIYD